MAFCVNNILVFHYNFIGNIEVGLPVNHEHGHHGPHGHGPHGHGHHVPSENGPHGHQVPSGQGPIGYHGVGPGNVCLFYLKKKLFLSLNLAIQWATVNKQAILLFKQPILVISVVSKAVEVNRDQTHNPHHLIKVFLYLFDLY